MKQLTEDQRKREKARKSKILPENNTGAIIYHIDRMIKLLENYPHEEGVYTKEEVEEMLNRYNYERDST